MSPSSSSSSTSNSRIGGGDGGSVSSHLPLPASSPMLLFGIGQHSVHQLPARLDPHMPLAADYFLPEAVLAATPTRLRRFL